MKLILKRMWFCGNGRQARRYKKDRTVTVPDRFWDVRPSDAKVVEAPEGWVQRDGVWVDAGAEVAARIAAEQVARIEAKRAEAAVVEVVEEAPEAEVVVEEVAEVVEEAPEAEPVVEEAPVVEAQATDAPVTQDFPGDIVSVTDGGGSWKHVTHADGTIEKINGEKNLEEYLAEVAANEAKAAKAAEDRSVDIETKMRAEAFKKQLEAEAAVADDGEE